jgi:type IV secretion system protein VirD4
VIFRIGRELRHYPKSSVVLAAIFWLTAYTVSLTPDLALDLAGHTRAEAARWADHLRLTAWAALAAGAVWWVGYWLVLPTTTWSWVARRDDEAEHAGGVATRLDIAQHASKPAMRKRATVLRPSLAQVSWWRRRFRTPVTEYAVKILTAGTVQTTSQVWCSVEDVVLKLGGPRMGKTGSTIPHVRAFPGPVVVTSTRLDLLDHTRDARADRGRVLVFNPTGIGQMNAGLAGLGAASTVRWSPLAGCTDFATAQRRAEDLIPVGSVQGEGERWDTQARGLLAVLLHAAALQASTGGEGSMRGIARWLAHPDTTTLTEITTALAASPDAAALTTEVRAVLTINDRTLTSITATLRPAIRWASEATAAQVGDATLTDPDFFDVAGFVAGHALSVEDLAAELDSLDRLGTPDGLPPVFADQAPELALGRDRVRRFDSLYLVGREGGCRPLIGALTAEIAHQARMAAAAMPAGRLDPPLGLILDEAPLTCGPVPLHDWTADMGGRGVHIQITAQSLAQLRDCWGTERAAAILSNTAALVVFGGIKSADDLQHLSTLTGTRMRRLDEDDIRPVPVMTPAEIHGLTKGQALLILTGLRPAVGRPDMGWPHPLRAALARVVTGATAAAQRGAGAVKARLRAGTASAGHTDEARRHERLDPADTRAKPGDPEAERRKGRTPDGTGTDPRPEQHARSRRRQGRRRRGHPGRPGPGRDRPRPCPWRDQRLLA